MPSRRNRILAEVLQRFLEGIAALLALAGLLTCVWLLFALPGNLLDGQDPEFADRDLRVNVPFAIDLPEDGYSVEAASLYLYDPSVEQTRGRLYFGTRRAWYLWAHYLLMLASLAVPMYFVWQLRQLLASIRRGSPFLRPNARRLRNVGLVVVLSDLLGAACRYAVGAAILDRTTVRGLALRPLLDWESLLGYLVLGLVILVIAEVFRQGAALAEEQSLTV